MPDDSLDIDINPQVNEQGAQVMERLADWTLAVDAAQQKLNRTLSANNTAYMTAGQLQRELAKQAADLHRQGGGGYEVQTPAYGIQGQAAPAGPQVQASYLAHQQQQRLMARVQDLDSQERNRQQQQAREQSRAQQAPLLRAQASVQAEIDRRKDQKLYHEEARKKGIGPSFLESMPVVGGLVTSARQAGEPGALAGAKLTAATTLAVGSMALLQHGFTQTAKIADTLGDSFLSTDQKSRAIAESLPLVGGLIRSFRQMSEALDGTTDRIRRYAVALELHKADIQQRTITEAPIMALQQQAAAARGRATVMGGAFPWAAMPFLGGVEATPRARGYAEQERAAAIAVEQAKREAKAGLPGIAAAKKNLADYQNQTAYKAMDDEAAEEKRRKYEKEHGLTNAKDWARDLDSAENKPQEKYRMRAYNMFGQELSQDVHDSLDAQQKDARYDERQETDKHRFAAESKQGVTDADELIQRRQQAKQMEEQLQGQILDQRQKELAVNKALVAADQTRLGILKSMEQHLRGQSSAFGGMLPGQQMMAVQYAKQAKERGFDSLLPGQRALLAQAGGGEFVRRGLEQKGEKNPLLAEFRALIGEKASLKEVVPEINKLTAKVQMDVVINEGALTASIAAAFEHFLGVLTAKIEKIGVTTTEKTERQIRADHADRGL